MHARTGLLRALLGGAAALGVGCPVVGAAVREERRQLADRARVVEALAQLAPAVRTAAQGQRVLLNGAPVYVRASASPQAVQPALEAVRDDCASGNAARMLGIDDLPVEGSRAPDGLKLARVDLQRADGGEAGAALCTFVDGQGRTRVRYVFARTSDAHASSLLSVTTEGGAPLEVLFPAEGDAAGGDLPGVPRPPASRRVFAADLEGSAYATRIYETADDGPRAMARYEQAMAAAGWSSSRAVASSSSEARAFLLGDETVVASFRRAGGATLVAIAPLRRR